MRTKRLGHFYKIRSRFSQYLLPKTLKVKKPLAFLAKGYLLQSGVKDQRKCLFIEGFRNPKIFIFNDML
jgi:hypothetical protein